MSPASPFNDLNALPVWLRGCAWTRVADADAGVEWVLIPGCAARAQDPAADCHCPTLQAEAASQASHRAGAERCITRLERELGEWKRAAAGAVEALSGHPPRMLQVLCPEALTTAVRQHLDDKEP